MVTYTSSVTYLSAPTGVSDPVPAYLFISEKVEERGAALPLASEGLSVTGAPSVPAGSQPPVLRTLLAL